MDWMLVAVLIVGIPVGLVVWLVARAVSARASIEQLARRVGALEFEIARLKRSPTPMASESAVMEKSAMAPPPIQEEAVEAEAPPWEQPRPVPPPLEPMTPAASVPPSVTTYPAPITRAVPMPPPLAASGTMPGINWEQFMGVKLFAWIGGLALFLGVAFFVKYSFENNLVSPELRVALGFIAGSGLLIGGILISRKDYLVLSQTLCATGIVILYAVTFACRSIYHFQFFGAIPTFLLMVLITTSWRCIGAGSFWPDWRRQGQS